VSDPKDILTPKSFEAKKIGIIPNKLLNY